MARHLATEHTLDGSTSRFEVEARPSHDALVLLSPSTGEDVHLTPETTRFLWYALRHWGISTPGTREVTELLTNALEPFPEYRPT